MTYYSDKQRHLVCEPYSVASLHQMATNLRIKRCWFHNGRWPHYDIPKTRLAEIMAKTVVVTPRRIWWICANGLEPLLRLKT